MKGWRQAAGWLLLVFSLVSFAFSLPAPRAGEEIAFGVSGPKDPDGKIVRYLWDFDGDSQEVREDSRALTPTGLRGRKQGLGTPCTARPRSLENRFPYRPNR